MTTTTLTRPTAPVATRAPAQAPQAPVTPRQPAPQAETKNPDAMPMGYRVASYAASFVVVALIAFAHFNQAAQMIA